MPGRRQRAIRAIAVAALLSAGAACSAITSLNGLTGGGGKSSPDGSTPEDSGTAGDAGGVVSPTGDSATPSEDAANGNDDAGGKVDAGGSGFCASQVPAPTFCDDFDEDPGDAGALAAAWDQVTGSVGTVTRAGTIFTSSPLAMLVTTKVPIKGSVNLAGYKGFTSFPRTGEFTSGTFTLSFDLYVAAADTSAASDAVLAAFEMVDSTTGERWALQLETKYAADGDDGGSALEVSFSQNQPATDGGTGYSQGPAVSQSIAMATWTRVTMIATTTDLGTAGIELELDGTTVSAPDKSVVIPVFSGIPEILVGVTYASPSSQGWVVRYDDVTFNASP